MARGKGGPKLTKSEIRKQKIEKKLKKDEPKPPSKSIDNERIDDGTFVENNDQEVLDEINCDKFSAFFNLEKKAKVVFTTSYRPHSKTIKFCRQFKKCMPDAIYRTRRKYSIKGTVQAASERGYTHLIVIQENQRNPCGIYVIALPEGPTAYFRLSSVQFVEHLKNVAGFSKHKPELIMNNFRTRLGLSVQRLLSTLFHFDPQFVGRRVITFHNQRDYIFFRHHRYEFKNGEKVALQEIGPRFTLKLIWLQSGTFDTKYGEYEFILKRFELEQHSRRRFFL